MYYSLIGLLSLVCFGVALLRAQAAPSFYSKVTLIGDTQNVQVQEEKVQEQEQSGTSSFCKETLSPAIGNCAKKLCEPCKPEPCKPCSPLVVGCFGVDVFG